MTDPGEAMDRWGDLPPGPWVAAVDDPEGVQEWFVFAKEAHRTAAIVLSPYGEDIARLLSKAWLLPRLEAALMSLVEICAWLDDQSERVSLLYDEAIALDQARVLLAELAKP